MTSAIALFGAFEAHDIRWNGNLDDPWWVAQDVCKVLGLTNITEALRTLKESELTSLILKSGGQDREMIILNEPGLYRLIFKSRKAEAEAFQRWVFHEVLPSIRKTGGYGTATPQNPFLHPDIQALRDTLNDQDLNLSALEMRLLWWLREEGAAGRDGVTLEEAMAAVGIHKSTFYRAVKRFVEFGLLDPPQRVAKYRFRNLQVMELAEVEDA